MPDISVFTTTGVPVMANPNWDRNDFMKDAVCQSKVVSVHEPHPYNELELVRQVVLPV